MISGGGVACGRSEFRRVGRWASLLVVVLTVAGMSLAALPGTSRAEPAPPRDKFYDVPGNIASLSPGEIIRVRKVQAIALQTLPINVDAWQLMYRTSDAAQAPDVAVTTLMAPRGKKPTKLLSYQGAIDATLRICQPSYGLTNAGALNLTSRTGPLTTTLPATETLVSTAGINEGWAVATPDHGGIDNRFLTPRQPGFATLDGIRAVQNFSEMKMSRSTPVAMWGYSGGAVANTWALEEQPKYAPELNIRANALGAPERDLAASLKSSNGKPIGGLIPIALSAIGKDSPEFQRVLNGYLTPAGRAKVAETRNHCIVQNLASNLYFDYRQYLKVPVDVVLNNPIVKRELDARGVTGRGGTAPTYIYNGLTEEVAPIESTDALVKSYCDAGTPVTYRREQLPPSPLPQLGSTHNVVFVTGAPGAFTWMKKQMNSTGPTARGCDTKTVPATALEPGNLAVLGPVAANSLKLLLGLPLGR